MKTVSITEADLKLRKNWVTVDAAGQTLGRLASQIAYVLRGKHKPTFVPHWDCGDNVIVTNSEKMKLTGRKLDQKVYYHHSGYVGGIKGRVAKDMLANAPEEMLTLAVKRMLPKNKLADRLILNLKVYRGTEHKHSAQKPIPMLPRTVKGA